jgi:hypothetical protein
MSAQTLTPETTFGLPREEGGQLAGLYFDQFPRSGDGSTLEEMLPDEFFSLFD